MNELIGMDACSPKIFQPYTPDDDKPFLCLFNG